MSNILILGIDGMLGNMLANVFSQKSSGKLFFTSRRDEPVNEYLNGEIINFDALSMGFTDLVSTVQPDFVINCIGAIKPLIKESDRKSVINAQTINSFLPKILPNLQMNLTLNIYKLVRIVFLMVKKVCITRNLIQML